MAVFYSGKRFAKPIFEYWIIEYYLQTKVDYRRKAPYSGDSII